MTRVRVRLAAALTLALAGAACEKPETIDVDMGFRGLGMQQVFNEERLARMVEQTRLPPVQPAVPDGPPMPAGTYRNVQVLNDLSVAEFNRTMLAITAWVSPTEGCTYCHPAGQELSSDSAYAKRVARRMLQMTREINGQWASHVGQTGVTCWTCHRGQPVPQNIWFFDEGTQPLRHYLDRNDIRVQSNEIYPSDANRSSIKQTEYTYALMISMSNSLGVNCTYCHNSPRWGDWAESPPQRVTALRGIRMVRELNNGWLLPLTSEFPSNRLGPMGDVAKIQCSTCHAGAYKPLYGARIAQSYPGMYWQSTPLQPAPVPADTAAVDTTLAPVPASPVVEPPAAPEGTGSGRR